MKPLEACKEITRRIIKRGAWWKVSVIYFPMLFNPNVPKPWGPDDVNQAQVVLPREEFVVIDNDKVTSADFLRPNGRCYKAYIAKNDSNLLKDCYRFQNENADKFISTYGSP